MGCLHILFLAVALIAPAKPTPAAKKPVQVAYLDCGFDARNVYRCRP